MPRILIRASTSTHYSGGRLYAWILAEAFAQLGYETTFWGDSLPPFVNDFADYPRHHQVAFHSGPMPKGSRPFDLVVVVPHLGGSRAFYPNAIALAMQQKARLALLNFETPNWFNAMSPSQRHLSLWQGWRLVASCADVILSMSHEGTRYARQFYKGVGDDCVFAQIHPPINSVVADSVSVHKAKQIIYISRFSNTSQHKGNDDLISTIGPHLKGFDVVVIAGGDAKDQGFLERLGSRCHRYGAKFRLLRQVPDAEKFAEIKRSQLLVFCSYFEGYGYPPLEALYCDVPCIAYDLPVLREVGGEGITFVPMGDTDRLRTAIAEQLTSVTSPSLKHLVAASVDFFRFCSTLKDVFEPMLNLGPKRYAPFAASSLELYSHLLGIRDTAHHAAISIRRRWRT